MKPFWQRLTLRNRTALIITLFIWVTGVSVGWICRSSFQALLFRQTEVDLTDDFNDFVRIVDGATLPFDTETVRAWNRRVAIHPLHRLFIRVVGEDRQAIWESITVPNSPPESAVLDSGKVQTHRSFRFIQTPIHLLPTRMDGARDEPQPIRALLQVGCSDFLVENTISQFDGWLLRALIPLCLGAPVLAFGLASWLLKPLSELTRTTQTIAIASQRLVERSGNRDEIDRLAETINSLLTRVRSQLRENEDWIANSAHQLRGPLAAIISNVEVVAGRIPDGKSSDMLQRVLSECEYLKRLVNQLLLLGEAGAKREFMVRQELLCSEMVAKSIDFYEALAQARGIQIRFVQLDPCTVFVNPEHLRFVIHNLIDNAIKYTQEGGCVEISLRRNEAENRCTLSVSDNGIGISPEDLPKIGRRFFRSNSGRDPSQTPRGTGLGLHIVRNIVDAVGGAMEIDSQLECGTQVRVSLPLASSPVTLANASSNAGVAPVESSQPTR